MNLGMRVHQDVNVSQQLNLAPQLLQWLRLLHVPTTELSAMVRHELETNPALEAEECASESEFDDSAPDDGEFHEEPAAEQAVLDEKQEFLMELDAEWGEDWTGGQAARASGGASAEDQAKHSYLLDSAVSDVSLYCHLLDQLPLVGLSRDDYALAELVIGSLDWRGYLTLSAQELAALAETDAARVERALTRVQAMEPAGVGARDLRECLLLQMADREPDFLPRRVTEQYLDAAAREQFAEIGRALGATSSAVREAVGFLATLDPAPGERFARPPAQFVEADVAVVRDNGAWRVDLDESSVPRLRISASCRRLLEKKTLTESEAAYVRDKIRAATFLIQGIGQRQDTLKKVAEHIARFQSEYLDSARGELKPLTMAKLAAMIGVHETTVSRALANKHIRTPRGLFEMKHFFRSGYPCADGSYVTPDKVKELIADIVENEPAAAPHRDTDIVALLKKRGLQLARRTIAKYREEMNIPSSKERKKAAAATRRFPFAAGRDTIAMEAARSISAVA